MKKGFSILSLVVALANLFRNKVKLKFMLYILMESFGISINQL